MAFCTSCGAEVPADIRFCTGCGNPMGEADQPIPVMAAASAPGSRYAVMSTGAYIGTMILFCIPIVGWLACIIMAFAAKNQNRRNFSRAMLVFLIIGIVLSVALYFVVSWAWGAVQEYMQQYISEATNGTVTNFDGLKDLFDIFSVLDGLELPSMSGQ